MANNLALLKINLENPLPDKENLDNLPRRATVHLPSPGQKFTDLVTLVGYGSTSNRVPRESGEKRLVSLPIAALARCRSLYGQNLINSGQLCAGDSYTGAGLCQGDAGSGAVQLDGDDAGEEGGAGRQVLVGVGSFGFDCGNGRYPSVFTAVADYVEWIQNSTSSV
ncbi:hypothetical protein TYRP_019750 [Tyrophagus putrescentiae]|nr:hypothetical protein TYRP_019750 [Tyrophagus putrescentiae]